MISCARFFIGLFVKTTEEGGETLRPKVAGNLGSNPDKILTIYILKWVWSQFLNENKGS